MVKTEPIHDIAAQFRDVYADSFARGMERFINAYGPQIFQQLREALKRERSVVYLFGNGGSHAISQCLKYALEAYAADHQLPVRVHTGIDVHQLSTLKTNANPGVSFSQLLHTEGANAQDLVILISGSGESDNLEEAARYAVQHGIPTIAFLGTRSGKIAKALPAERCCCSSIEDQQVAEDLIQAVAYFFDVADEVSAARWFEVVSQRAEDLRQAIRNIPASFLVGAAESIVDAFFAGQTVWVYGLDHPALSVTAEHTAHNLYWDSVYQVPNPPRRFVSSSPTACNFTGISNDRRRRLIEYLSGIEEGMSAGGVAVLYAMKAESTDDRASLIAQLGKANVSTCLFVGGTPPAVTPANILVHASGLDSPQMQAGLSQVFGHILGRLVRMKLLNRNRSETLSAADPSAARFLIDFDLAQRRLLE